MMEISLADAAGAVLISKRQFNKLPENYRKVLLEKSKEYFTKLMTLSREENKKSIEALKKQGVKMVPAPGEAEVKQFYKAGKRARRLMAPKLYSIELVEEVEKALEAFRSAK